MGESNWRAARHERGMQADDDIHEIGTQKWLMGGGRSGGHVQGVTCVHTCTAGFWKEGRSGGHVPSVMRNGKILISSSYVHSRRRTADGVILPEGQAGKELEAMIGERSP